ncbi:MAG TPA: CmcI family methyltransferase [Solirubrobacteraceae bacterium]|jgi:cephalosporin hydroxylase
MTGAHAPSLKAELERMVRLTKAPIEERLTDSMRNYWLERVANHTQDSYAGVPLSKFPEDLRVYEHLLWADRPNAVIEIGSHCGASALWFRDRLRTLACYGAISEFRVVTIDVQAEHARPYLDRADRGWEENVSLVSGDVRDESLPARIAELLPDSARCFVVEDSAHVYDTTMAALTGFARFVSPGGFFVVEDGCVDVEAMRLEQSWPRGVLPAVADWLAGPAGGDFVARRDLEFYGMTCHPNGLLQRRT